MLRARLTGARGQLVVWYLSILAVLLLALGVFQSVVLADSLRSNVADELRRTATSELTLLGVNFTGTVGELSSNAQPLAQLLGSTDVAVKIVTPDGQALADHGFGPPGAQKPLIISARTIRSLIRMAGVPAASGVGTGRGSVDEEGLLLVAVPIGQPGKALGYAIMGRSLSSVNRTITQVRLVFLFGALIALLLAALIALPIINRALRPLRRIADTAEAIAAGDLAKRVNLVHSPDEIGRLGAAFDTMIDRLQAALDTATASEERMSRFLADASHELRTPLTVLRGTSEVLLRQRQIDPDDLRSSLIAIKEESERLSRLVDDLLTLSRLDAGQSLDPHLVRLRPFLTRFVDRYGGAWPRRRVDAHEESLDGVEVFVDPDALTRILTNLVDNAARYSTPGHDIHIEAKPDGECVTVQVRDEGPGMEPEEAERLFERFKRAESGRARRSGGTGLGLAIVRALAEGSNGIVTIDTAPGRGTTVLVRLPRAQDAN